MSIEALPDTINFDFHSHTWRAKRGKKTAGRMMMAAREKDFDYFALTAHNRSLLVPDAIVNQKGRTRILPGFELSTGIGHASVIGIQPEIANQVLDEFDLLDVSPNIIIGYNKLREVLEVLNRLGALVVADHPLLSFFSPIPVLAFTPWMLADLGNANLIQGAENHNIHIKKLLKELHLGPLYGLWSTYTTIILEALNIPCYLGSDAHDDIELGARNIVPAIPGDLITNLRERKVQPIPAFP